MYTCIQLKTLEHNIYIEYTVDIVIASLEFQQRERERDIIFLNFEYEIMNY